jgi:hypothetical protein
MDNTNKQYKVEDLFSDSGPFDEQKVAAALFPIITVQKKSNKIFFKSNSLSALQKILAYALTKKLLKSKGFVNDDKITAQEVFNETGIKKGTVDPTFKILRDKGLLVGEVEYEIPTFKTESVIEILVKNSK